MPLPTANPPGGRSAPAPQCRRPRVPPRADARHRARSRTRRGSPRRRGRRRRASSSAPASQTGSVRQPRDNRDERQRLEEEPGDQRGSRTSRRRTRGTRPRLCPPDPTVASAHTATSPAERAMLEARNPGLHPLERLVHRRASVPRSTWPARKSSASASTHLTTPIAMSDGCGARDGVRGELRPVMPARRRRRRT